MSEPENLVLKLLRELREDIATKRDFAALRDEIKNDIAGVRSETAGVRSEMKSLRADVTSEIERMSERVAHLNRAVIEYHSSAVGHGILISEFEDRLRRVEQQLKIPPREVY
jgi:predicted  nucleic acid-binding Zn-ribbon protein